MYSAIEKYDRRDFEEEIVWNNSKKKESKTFSNIKYNQKLVDDYSCTWAAAIGVISDVTGYALPLSFREQVWENQLNTWAKEGFGDTIQNGMKQAVKLFNEEFKELPYSLKYYRISNIKDIIKLLRVLKISSIQTWYTWNLRADAEDNWIIDNTNNPNGSGHCIRIVKAWYDGQTLKVKYCDNYEGINKYNVIQIDDFLANSNFFSGGYYIKKVYK